MRDVSLSDYDTTAPPSPIRDAQFLHVIAIDFTPAFAYNMRDILGRGVIGNTLVSGTSIQGSSPCAPATFPGSRVAHFHLDFRRLLPFQDACGDDRPVRDIALLSVHRQRGHAVHNA